MPGGGSRHIVGSELGLADARGGGGGANCQFNIQPQSLAVTGSQSCCNCCQLSCRLCIVRGSTAKMSWHLFPF